MAEARPGAPVAVGDRLPELVKAPIERATLALFAGASHDHNPLHIDSDFARAAGLDDVCAHGMLSMAYLAQMLTRWAPQARLRHWNVRFAAITPLRATVTCRGEVVEIYEDGGRRLARVRIGCWIADGRQTIDGEAVVDLVQEH